MAETPPILQKKKTNGLHSVKWRMNMINLKHLLVLFPHVFRLITYGLQTTKLLT